MCVSSEWIDFHILCFIGGPGKVQVLQLPIIEDAEFLVGRLCKVFADR